MASVQAILDRPDVRDAIKYPRRIDRTHDVPYLAGSNAKGGVTYIDRRVPQTLKVEGQRGGIVHLDPAEALNVHEQVEHALMVHGGMPYETAHRIALKHEQKAVEKRGAKWSAYQAQMHKLAATTQAEKPSDPPADLYTKPYPHSEAEFLKREAIMHKSTGGAVAYHLRRGGSIRVLGQGNIGDTVTDVQKKLANLGYDVDVDGKYGAQTRAAVLQFQKDHGLKLVDGLVGPETSGALTAATMPMPRLRPEAKTTAPEPTGIASPAASKPDTTGIAPAQSAAPVSAGMPKVGTPFQPDMTGLAALHNGPTGPTPMDMRRDAALSQRSRYLSDAATRSPGLADRFHLPETALQVIGNNRPPPIPDVAARTTDKAGYDPAVAVPAGFIDRMTFAQPEPGADNLDPLRATMIGKMNDRVAPAPAMSQAQFNARFDPVSSGLLSSSVAGRTDRLPIAVPSDSYVVPADVVSGLGQGNTQAGARILDQISTLHAGMKRGGTPHASGSQRVPIVAAGGEYIVHPAAVASMGGGDMNKGHKVLDRMVMNVRRQTANRLKTLPGPKK